MCTFRGQHAQAGGTTGGTAAGTLKVAVPGTGEPCPLLLSTRLSSRCFALIADSHVTRQWYRYRACPVSDIGKLLSPTVQVRRARCFRTYPKLNLNPSAFLMLRMLAADLRQLRRARSSTITNHMQEYRGHCQWKRLLRLKILCITANDAAEIEG